MLGNYECVKEWAVLTRNLYKSYNGNAVPVLNNFNMNVNKGTIYSFLGASGSGKTTLCEIIAGTRNWDSGELYVLGKRLKNRDISYLGRQLGYMPQSLALYNHLSARETMQYFGTLYHMSKEQIRQKWKAIKALLELRDDTAITHTLSGGQKRRVSLALALLHSPSLLLLDEPTVGLDPLLRQKVWEYLEKIVKVSNCTIIITTHYTEEARNSDTIGVIRNGQLIAEDSPISLLEKYNCDLIEQVVTFLCHADELAICERNSREPRVVAHIAPSIDTQPNNSCLPDSKSHTLWQKISTCVQNKVQRVYGFIVVMLLTLLRHPVFFLMIMIMPTIQCGLNSASLGEMPKDLSFGVVNHDLKNWTEECGSWQDYENTTSCTNEVINCMFLSKLGANDLLILNDVDSESVALEKVERGENWGYLVIPDNYSQHMLDFGAQQRFASNETLEGIEIRFRLDNSNQLAAAFITKHFYQTYLDYTAKLKVSCGLSDGESQWPLEFGTVYGDMSDSYVEFILPGSILMSLFSLNGMLTSLIFIVDFKLGTLSRATIAGLTNGDIILTHYIVQSLVTLLQTGILTWFHEFALGITFHGSTFLYIMMCLASGLCASAIGLLVGIVCREEVEIFVVGIFMFPIFMLYGGATYPVELASWAAQQVSNLVPIKLPIDSLRSILIRELSFIHPLVWPGFAVALGWTIALTMACKKLLKTLDL